MSGLMLRIKEEDQGGLKRTIEEEWED